MQISQLFLPEVLEAIDSGDLESLRTVFEDLHPSDVAELIENLSSEKVAAVIRLLRFPNGIDVFEQLDVQTQVNVLDHLGRTETINIIEELSADDRVDLIQRLPAEVVDSLFPFIAQAERDEIRRLLQYDEHTAGAVMTTEYAQLPADITVGEALSQLRKIASGSETIYYIYLTDNHRRLIGAVSLRQLVLSRPQVELGQIMSKDPISVPVDMDQEEVLKIFEKYDFLAVPVVDKEMKLVGIVTHDDIIDIAVQEQTEDVHKLGAIEPLTDSYFRSRFWSVVKKRGTWLMLLFFGQFFTFNALSHYEDTLQKAVTLMFFLPLIIASGGNSGSQSVTLITRGLAIGDVRMQDFFKVVQREAAIGFFLGLFLCVVGIVWSRLIWSSSWNICFTVGISLVCVVTLGALIGAILPMVFKRFGYDPAIMSSPFVASIVDVFGIIIYLSLAQYLLSL